MMASPDAQTSALINIAQCYADSATDLDAETRRLLEEIQQRRHDDSSNAGPNSSAI